MKPVHLQHMVQDLTPQKILAIQFGMFSGLDMNALSEITVSNRDLYQHPTYEPVPHGLLDERMGISNKKLVCKTCFENIETCPGHFGSIKLALPVFHIGYIKSVYTILKCICKTCARILMTPEQILEYTRRITSARLDLNQCKAFQLKLLKICQSTTNCPYCNAFNGDIRKVSSIKFIHRQFKSKASDFARSSWEKNFDLAIQYNSEISQYLSNCGQDFFPTQVLSLFKKITPQDCLLLGVSHRYSRPEWMILTHLLVPPCTIRPSVQMDQQGGSNEDDLTVELQEIVWVSEIINSQLEQGRGAISQIVDNWDILQLHVALYINSESPGISPGLQTGKPIRGLCQRLKGKQGRFRGNLSGKRVDFTSRTVISPDPNLNVHQVGVPVDVASTLTYPERVNRYNIDEMRSLVINGPGKHPGAISVIYSSDGSKRMLKYGDRMKSAADLAIGDIIERHLKDGDIVLFNRQPSLHRVSIMAHQARVMPWKTFRFNECVCAPYNADFDGDEMNLHLPQTEEARAEAKSLMFVTKNLIGPKSGEMLISATQDFLTASWILTSKDRFFTHSEFYQLVSGMFKSHETFDLIMPALIKPVVLYTGKQLISMLIEPLHRNRRLNSGVNINMRVPLKNHDINCRLGPLSPQDTYMVFQNGHLLSGQLDKSVLGGGKNTLFAALVHHFGHETAADRMSRLARLCSRFIGNHGFSIGISDVTPTSELMRRKSQLVSDGYRRCDQLIEDYHCNRLEHQAGSTPEQTLEGLLEGTLSEIRDAAGKLCIEELSQCDKFNSPLIMTLCGSKGSKINVSQMTACVGQQSVNGQRIPNGFINRSLPHFDFDSKHPAAKGFVSNSFFTGLTPTEFFFHTMGGREGLVDTAVKTAETGYMQRRLMKALEDLSVQYDGTVRDTNGNLVQFKYGEDGVEPTLTEGDSSAFDLDQHWQHALLSTITLSSSKKQPKLTRDQLKQQIDAHLQSLTFKSYSEKFQNSVRNFFDKNVLQNESYIKLNPIYKNTLEKFFNTMRTKMVYAQAEPGTAVGGLCAQSIGEPCTQMTLKTFHFAGVASMNITLGVPRIREIINVTKNISTPIIEARLSSDNSKEFARLVKNRIECTTLGQVCEYIREVYTPQGCHLLVKIDLQALKDLYLECSPQSIRQVIIAHKKLKLKDEHVVVVGKYKNKIQIFPPDVKAATSSRSASKDTAASSLKQNVYFALQTAKSLLPSVVVAGLETVKRSVIREDKANSSSGQELNTYSLLVEGQDILGVMTKSGIQFDSVKSNHLIQVQNSLGIEASRRCIINEIAYTMKLHGVYVDPRHLFLLADCMTSRGETHGITRFGISKMNDSALMLASFEKTTDHLFNAGQRALSDKVSGVSECIIMGKPIPLGTGSFELLHDGPFFKSLPSKFTPKPTLLSSCH